MESGRQRVALITVGIDEWKKTTRKFVDSLLRHNPNANIYVIDNGYEVCYPKSEAYTVIRSPKLVGYAKALNMGLGAALLDGGYDWYVCFNNDNICDGEFLSLFDELDPNVLYGSGWNYDYNNGIEFQWSAWLAISNKILEATGGFDPKLDGAFEDFDIQLRATYEGFKLNTLELPVSHLDKHTRFKSDKYGLRWERSRIYFEEKHGVKTTKWTP